MTNQHPNLDSTSRDPPDEIDNGNLNNRWRSPRLRAESDSERERHANWLELFFDLVFVVAVTELSHTLETHLTLTGFWQFVVLFVPCWWAWTMFTFYIDRYDVDDVVHRLAILGGMLSILFLSANIHNVFSGKGSVWFALSYVAIRSIVLFLYVRVAIHVPLARINRNLYLVSYIPSTILWLGSISFAEPTRFILWAIAMIIELVIPFLSARRLATSPVDPAHLPERFGLLTLIVLGELIVSVARTTAGNDWALMPAIAATIGFGIAACLWWIYFDFLETVVIIRDARSVDVYNYGHLPIIMGLALVSVGIQLTIESASSSLLPDAARWTLCGGVALCLLAIMAIWTIACRRHLSWQMTNWIAIVTGLAVFGESLSPLALEGFVLIVLVAKVTLKILHPNVDRTKV